MPMQVKESQTDPQRISLCWQILLTSALFGVEASIGFFQIYTVLFLQYMGVPLYLVSVDGIITVVFSLILIPLIGYFTDRGANPKIRKMVAILLGMMVLLMGCVTVIIASSIKLVQLLKQENSLTEERKLDISHFLQNTTSESRNDTIIGDLDTLSPRYSTTSASFQTTAEDGLGIPLTAILAIGGISLLNIGYDTTATSSRAFIVVSVPPNQRMDILATATLMQAISGNIFSLVGVSDLSNILGNLFNVDGITASYIVFASYTFISVLVGFVLTCVSSHVIGLRLEAMRKLADTKESDSVHHLDKVQRTDFNSSIKYSFYYNKEISVDCASIAIEDGVPLLGGDHSHDKRHYASIEQNNKASGKDASSEVPYATGSESKSLLSKLGLNTKVLLLSLSFFFGMGAMFSFVEYLPNVLTVGIYHGDPKALPGTEGHALYEKGQRMASLGNLIFYFTLLLMSMGNKFVLKFMSMSHVY